MAQKTLKHCEEWTAPEVDPPQNVQVIIDVGGSAGDGGVTVSTNTGETQAQPCGSAGQMEFGNVTTVSFHFQQAPEGPDSVDIQFAINAM